MKPVTYVLPAFLLLIVVVKVLIAPLLPLYILTLCVVKHTTIEDDRLL